MQSFKMHSGLLEAPDLVQERKERGQQYNTCAPSIASVRIIEKVKQERTEHATFGKRKSLESLSHGKKGIWGAETLNT